MSREAESKPRSVRSRLLRWLLPPLLLVAAIGIGLQLIVAVNRLDHVYDEALGNAARAAAAAMFGDTKSRRDIDSILPKTAGSDRRHLLIVDAQGGPVSGDTELTVRSSSRDPDLRFVDTTRRGQPLRMAVLRLRVEGRDRIVVLAETTLARDAARRSLLLATVAGSLLQLLLTLMVVWFGVRLGLSALLRLRDTVARRDARDFTPVPMDTVPDEASPLVATLNRAIERTRDAAEARQRFIDDAAHQLRNPLVAVHAGLVNMEIQLRGTPRHARARQLLEDSRRITRTTRQLLAMARTDAAGAVPRECLDLRDVVVEQAQHHLDRALECGIDLGIEAANTRVEGVRWLLTEVLSNLLDNALAYSPHGSRVTLHCGERDGVPFLAVEDDGPGIAADEREQVRARFHRGRSAQGDGTGLGLAIVEQAAHVHGADFTIEDGAAGRGTICSLHFPPAMRC